MCHRVLIDIVERLIYLFTLSNGKEKKKKKSPTASLEGSIFHVLYPFKFGAWLVCSTSF